MSPHTSPHSPDPPLPTRGPRSFLNHPLLAAVLTLLLCGCSGQDEARPGSIESGGELPGVATGACESGKSQACSITIEQQSGIISCFRGEQSCEDGRWGPCEDGVLTREADPTFGWSEPGAPGSLSLSTPQECLDNPCDLGCMFFDEDPEDITPMGGEGVADIPDWSAADTTAMCRPDATTAHGLCQVGEELTPGCHGCVDAVCAVDPSCCSASGTADEWDQACVNLVYTVCADYPTIPSVLDLCDFAAFGKESVSFSNAGTGSPVIGSADGVTLATDCTVEDVYAVGEVTIANQCAVAGDVVTEAGMTLAASADSSVAGNVRAGEAVVLYGSSHVGGNLTSSSTVRLEASAYVEGELLAGGDVTLRSNAYVVGATSTTGSILGETGAETRGLATINPGQSISSSITTTGGTDLMGSVTRPEAPIVELPDLEEYVRDLGPSCFFAGVLAPDQSTSGSDLVLPPGIYGDLTIAPDDSLILDGGGDYIFNSIRFGDGGSGEFELGGTGPWNLSLCGTLHLGNGTDVVLEGTTTPNDPTDLFIYSGQTSGNGVTFGVSTSLSGIILAPQSNIVVGNGFSGTASFWAKNVDADTSFDLTSIPRDDCEGVDPIGEVSCGGIAPLYSPQFSYPVGGEVHLDGIIYSCNDATDCSDPDAIPGVTPLGMSAWDVVDDCPETDDPNDGRCPVDFEIPAMPPARQPCYSGLDCQLNSHCTEVLTDSACGASKCATGPALPASCDPCVALICEADSTCCSDSWDADCVAMVQTVCDASCDDVIRPACEHDLCVTGPAITEACSDEATAVCETPGFESCCTSSWDLSCVNQLFVETTGSPRTPPGETVCDYGVLGTGSTSTLLSTTIIGDVGWLTRPSSVDVGSVRMVEESAGAGFPTITGDVFVSGSFEIINGDVAGNIFATVSATTTGTTYDSVNEGATIPNPTRPTASLSCGTGAPDRDLSSDTTLSAGTYGDVIVRDGYTLTLSGSDYTFENLTVESGATIDLGTGPVDVGICQDMTLGAGTSSKWASIVSPTGDPLQGVFFSESGTISVGNEAQVDGALLAETGAVSLGHDVSVRGLVHSYASQVRTYAGTIIDASGATGTACITRGIDPAPPVSACPISTPLSATVNETGTCVDNGNPLTHDQPWCSGQADLSLVISCDPDTVTVCNHGEADVPASAAELVFYPRAGAQFAHAPVEDFWEKGRCAVDQVVSAGSCVDQVCPSSLVDEDLTVRIELDPASGVTECSTLDNWGYSVEAPSCSYIGGSESRNYIYEAECPDDDQYPSWGLLTWDSVAQGGATIEFEGRTALEEADLSGEGFTLLGVAEESADDDTQQCFVDADEDTTCPIDLTAELYPDDPSAVQGRFLELQITLTTSGPNVPSLADWRVTYSCIEDQ